MIIEHTIENVEAKVLISNQLLERMYEFASEYYPDEFGGILSGFREGNRIVVVDFETPSKIESNGNKFVRHADNLNVYLSDIYQVSEGILEYIGEWHSHPGSSAQYSSNDKQSMIQISKDKKVKINNPIMVILSIVQRANSYKLYMVQDDRIVWMNKILLS